MGSKPSRVGYLQHLLRRDYFALTSHSCGKTFWHKQLLSSVRSKTTSGMTFLKLQNSDECLSVNKAFVTQIRISLVIFVTI